MNHHDLNNPDTRQSLLAQRLADGAHLVASALAQEFCVSLDTIRRDLISMEDQGLLKRVRGGAVPVSPPSAPFHTRVAHARDHESSIAKMLLSQICDGMVLILDGGTSVLDLTRQLPLNFSGLVITPGPAIALAAQERNIETILIGGRLSRFGGVSVGSEAERFLATCAADLCVLGACGLHAAFGLSADDLDEASVKRQMSLVSNCTAVIAGRKKLGRRARHQVLPCASIHFLATDADQDAAADFRNADIEVIHA